MDIKKILPAFSYIFHPIFISLYGIGIYFWLTEIGFNSLSIILFIQVIILTILLPLSTYFLLKATGYIQSFTEASINERKFPILLQAVFIFILIKFSGLLDELPAIYFFLIGGLIASLLALIFALLNFKVSLHMIGISSLLCFTVSLSVYLNLMIIPLISILIVFLGNVASSRLFMKSHTPIELVAGTLIGFISQIIVWQYYL
jgi:hypothetical protein